MNGKKNQQTQADPKKPREQEASGKHNNGQTQEHRKPNRHSQQKHDSQAQGQEKDRESQQGDHHARMVADFRQRFWISLVLTLPILALSPMIRKFVDIEPYTRLIRETMGAQGSLYALFALSSVIFLYGGYPFLKGLFQELRQMQPGMMTLIGIAITVAYGYSGAVVFGLSGRVFFWELATLVDVMLLGHWVEMKSVMGASRALEELARLMPSEAHKLQPEGGTRDVPIDELEVGDRILVKPGEKVPADGRVEEGESAVNEAMLTGESTPVTKEPGAEVIGGSINGEGSLTLEVQKMGEDSYLSQMMTLVEEAQKSKSKAQNLADRAALWLTIIALSAGAVTLLVWLVVVNRDFAFALERTVTVMVITCPHALGLAVPLVVAVSTALSASNGLLIRDRAAFERARNIQAIIFDKTGTLTLGEFGVTEVVAFDNKSTEKDILHYAASLEAHSEHPIAKGIVASAEETSQVEDFQSITGKGAQGKVNGKEVKVVSPGYLRENNISFADDRVEELSGQGKTVVFVLIDGELQGAIALADIIREESPRAISRLKEMGIKSMMLTGDNKRVARWVAEEIGIEEYFAEVLPEEKADKVKEVQNRGLLVAMTGDGVNDAPALAQADVGIAVGAGTDVAVATADIILVRSNPLDVMAIMGLARATYKKMLQNLAWATGYNAFAIPLAAGVLYKYGVLLSPAVGAALMSLSTVIVAVNAKFLHIQK